MLLNQKKYKGLKTRYEKQWISKSRQYPEYFNENGQAGSGNGFEPKTLRDITEVFQSGFGATARSEKKVFEDFLRMLELDQDMGEKPIDTFLEMLESGFDDSDSEDLDYDEMIGEPEKPYVRTQRKVGRNEPCPCGSEKKYKLCCGRSGARVV